MPKKVSFPCLTSFFIVLNLLLAGCAGNPTPAPTPTPSPTLPPAPENLPEITSVELDRPELPRYESLEIKISVDAEYTNPYDAREITLQGTFTGPDGEGITVPGFWDARDAWRIRFTPDLEGAWHYALTLTDANGTSTPAEGAFTVTPSDLHGWLQPGNWVNPDYSGHYFVYHDGTPFYGVGHGDALNILADRFDAENGVGLFDNMKEAGENYVVWWPLYTNSPVNKNYDDYSQGNVDLIDVIVQDAQKENIFLIFTIWDHPQLRDNTHAWGTGNWENNGFKNLGSLESFFTSEEAWAWQTNLYRYLIARWGYSPAIGMWQTVSEINGTNAYDQLNPWHEKVNAYFVENDPYRHPTTASMSGDVDWPEGHAATDVPQVHLYAFEDAVGAAGILADWTSLLFNGYEKPNWVGEFGVGGNSVYPELFHNAIWAALANGAAMTPAEWNSSGVWGRMTPEMNADIHRLAQFVDGMPLALWDPAPLQISSSDPEVRAWGLTGQAGGMFWVQDFALEGEGIEVIRADHTLRSGVELQVLGLPAGTFTITPYDTWQGTALATFEASCLENEPCTISLPDFTSDMAFKWLSE